MLEPESDFTERWEFQCAFFTFGSPTVRSISFALSTLSWKMGIFKYFSKELSMRTTGTFLLFISLIFMAQIYDFFRSHKNASYSTPFSNSTHSLSSSPYRSKSFIISSKYLVIPILYSRVRDLVLPVAYTE